MRLKLLIAAALLAAVTVATGNAMGIVSSAMAQGQCIEPVMPMPVDGSAATADQMRAAMAEARNFIAQSGLYQECLQKEVDGAKSQAAAAGQPVEPTLEPSIHARLDASKKAQERVGVTVNNALAAYKNTHPH